MSTHVKRPVVDRRSRLDAGWATPPPRRRRLGPIVALTLALLGAGTAGIATTAYLTQRPASAPSGDHQLEPNANQREGRVGVFGSGEPNANQREGRVP